MRREVREAERQLRDSCQHCWHPEPEASKRLKLEVEHCCRCHSMRIVTVH